MNNPLNFDSVNNIFNPKPSTEFVSDEYLHVNSCGIQYFNNIDDETIRENGRLDYHILYIAEGRCYAEINGVEEVVNAGGIILFAPGEKQKYKFKKDDSSISCFIHFTGTGCKQLLSDMGMDEQRIVHMGKSNTIKSLFESMSIEYVLKKPFYNTLCSAHLMELLGIISRRVSRMNNPVYIKNKTDVDAVCLLMHEKYAENLPLKYYADFCNVSVSRFAHIFKASMGVSPLEFIIQIRINYAKDFLLNTNLSITKISELTGFSNQNYFGRVFKQHTGMSPKSFAENG